MLILVEGSRHVGKTHLMDAFFAQNTDPRVQYYKFQFSKYLSDLGLEDQETGPGIHYFSIANVLTIFELNNTIFKDKILVFDRSIFSAYVWSMYRRRMHEGRLMDEFEAVLSNSELFHDVSVLHITRSADLNDSDRDKSHDYFDNFENPEIESRYFSKVYYQMTRHMADTTRNNSLEYFNNNFDEESIARFNKTMNNIVNSIPVLG